MDEYKVFLHQCHWDAYAKGVPPPSWVIIEKERPLPEPVCSPLMAALIKRMSDGN